MASSTTYFSILLFLTLLSFLHVHARDSQFFSKMSNTNANNNAKDTTTTTTTQLLPTKEEQPPPLNKPAEQEPNFIPQNQQNAGYGLYGHESGQLPPSTTSENLPYKSENQEFYNNNNYYNKDAYVAEQQGMSDTRFMDKAYTTPTSNNNNNNNNNYYNNDAYVTGPQGMSDTRYMDKAYTTPTTNNNNNYYNGDNMYNNRQQGMREAKFMSGTNGNNHNNNMGIEKQGMSDTRFLENGRYYYDPKSEENNYYLNSNANENSRNNEFYNNRGNYGNSFGSRSEYNNNRGQFWNSENSYEPNNSMEGYNQNQEEFEESQDEQFMP